MLTRIHLENFTVFKDIDIELSPGINIFIGENGTGKTHLLKVMYAATSTEGNEAGQFITKVLSIFLPDNNELGHLVHQEKSIPTNVAVENKLVITEDHGIFLQASLPKTIVTMVAPYPLSPTVQDTETPRFEGGSFEDIFTHFKDHVLIKWRTRSVFIPAKEALSFAPHFRSTYDAYHIHFEATYNDLIERCALPSLRDITAVHELMNRIERLIGGTVTFNMIDKFYLVSKDVTREFDLIAEGHRKLGILWLLLRNGMLSKDSILFWDEPEANLNPKLIKELVGILVELERIGVQIFISTHSSDILQEFDLQAATESKVMFHSLYKIGDEVKSKSTDNYGKIDPDPLGDAANDSFNRYLAKRAEGVK